MAVTFPYQPQANDKLVAFTVKPPQMDTSCKQTPPISGHLVVVSAMYKHYIFNLPLNGHLS